MFIMKLQLVMCILRLPVEAGQTFFSMVNAVRKRARQQAGDRSLLCFAISNIPLWPISSSSSICLQNSSRQQQQESKMACPAAAMRFSRCAAQRVCFSVSSVFSRRMHTCSSHASSTPVPAAAAADGSSSSRPLVLLGIESSCDDTGAAVLTSDGNVLGEALATQAELHAPWGGVVPSIAQAAHKEAIDRVVEAALSQAGISAAQLDAVAVTVGPGLSLCLDVGIRKAREVSRQHSLPLVPVHHMEVSGSQPHLQHVVELACLSVHDNLAPLCASLCGSLRTGFIT